MRIVIMLTMMTLLTVSVTATLQTTKPHPVFTPATTYTIAITTECRADTIVTPDMLVALFEWAFTTEINRRYGTDSTHPVILFSPAKTTADGTRITVTIKGYNITLASCSLYIDYTITDAVSTFADTAITTYTIDTKILRGTYNDKKTAACEQGVQAFVISFLDTFLAGSDK